MTRLDRELVSRGLARSRGHARDLITSGAVRVGGTVTRKAAQPVSPGDDITLAAETAGHGGPVLDAHWVSRAAGKLLGAFADLAGGGPPVQGRRAADVGACTGGFTQVLLERGAAHVHAIDVGHDQLVDSLRNDDRVTDLSGLNARDLEPDHVDGGVDLVVADLSFISLTLVLERLAAITVAGGDLLVLIKPQFEVGRAGLDGRGIVRPGPGRRDAVRSGLTAARDAGLAYVDLVVSRTPGQDGNTEFVAWLRAAADATPRPAAPTDRPDAVDTPATWDSVHARIDQLLAQIDGQIDNHIDGRQDNGTDSGAMNGAMNGDHG